MSLPPKVTPPSLILAQDVATLGNIAFSSLEFIRDNHSPQLGPLLEILFGKNSREQNLVQIIVPKGPQLVSLLDLQYPSILRTKNSNISSSQRNHSKSNATIQTNYKYFLGEDKILLITGQSYQLINVTPATYYPTLANNKTDYKVLNYRFLFNINPTQPKFYRKAKQLIATPKNKWLVFTIARIPRQRVAILLCFNSFIFVNANVTITAKSLSNKLRLETWNIYTRQFSTEAI